MFVSYTASIVLMMRATDSAETAAAAAAGQHGPTAFIWLIFHLRRSVHRQTAE